MYKARFGPAGNSESFYDAGYKSSFEMPKYLGEIGLGAYEYQCGKGVNVSEETAKLIGDEAKKRDILLSLHSPYYISMSNPDPERVEKTVKYIIDSMRIADIMGARRVVVHTGAKMKFTREEGMKNVRETMKIALKEADGMGLGHVNICPETMGKTNQLGDLEEVLSLCLLDERLIPTVDFGHLNARTFGGLKTYEDFKALFDMMDNTLGAARAKSFHSHFSKIEYTDPGGEKRHLTFADNLFGPDFDHVAEFIAQKDMSPVIICESAGTQTDDALTMQKMYRDCVDNRR